MRTLGNVYAPLDRARARYCVPLGTCTATTVAPSTGVPVAESVTTPLSVAVVTPWAESPCGIATDNSNASNGGSTSDSDVSGEWSGRERVMSSSRGGLQGQNGSVLRRQTLPTTVMTSRLAHVDP